MRQGEIILLVCLVVLMLVWALALLGAVPAAVWSGWLPWGTCLCLAIAVFLVRQYPRG